MNIRVTENLHCIGAVGRKRETLCRFITQDVFLLTTTAECARKLKNQNNKKKHLNFIKCARKKHKIYSPKNANEQK